MKLTFSHFMLEGGWAKTITQSTKLTPALAKKALSAMPKFEKDFNAFLRAKGEIPISIGKPVGSSAYIDRDIQSNPTKEYGDIDIIFNIPRIEGMPESKNSSKYFNFVKEFVASADFPYLFKDPDNGGTAIIVKAGDEWVQVDLVKAFSDISDWVQHRMTPEYNVKGALIGYLYSSLAEVLQLSIGSNGVQAKEKSSEFIPFRNLKADKVHTISTDISKFGIHIIQTFFDRAPYPRSTGKPRLKISSDLKSTPGMTRDSIKVSDLIKIIKGIGKSFEENEMFGIGDLNHISGYDDYISKIKNSYIQKTEDGAKSTKFNKASTPEAKERAEKTKDLLMNKSKAIADLLD
jgi:hypothetical protein